MKDRPSYSSCSGLIIADSRLRPFSGDTASSKHMVELCLTAFSRWFDEVILVAENPVSFLQFDAPIASHQIPGCGLWSGLHAGLSLVRHPFAFCTGIGSPPISAELLQLFLSAAGRRCDAVLAPAASSVAPLPGLYSRNCLKTLSRCLAGDDFDGRAWLRQVRVHILAPEALREVAPDWQPHIPGC